MKKKKKKKKKKNTMWGELKPVILGTLVLRGSYPT
jgi:hypothetical protein